MKKEKEHSLPAKQMEAPACIVVFRTLFPDQQDSLFEQGKTKFVVDPAHPEKLPIETRQKLVEACIAADCFCISFLPAQAFFALKGDRTTLSRGLEKHKASGTRILAYGDVAEDTLKAFMKEAQNILPVYLKSDKTGRTRLQVWKRDGTLHNAP